MCVILIADTERVSRSMLHRAAEANPHGIGMAWRGQGQVRWDKGITEQRAAELIKSIPLPYLIHCRIATAGRPSPALCHPFPISEQANTTLRGHADRVLAHNGHWSAWQTILTVLACTTSVPDGEWSDSRLLAYVLHRWDATQVERLLEPWERFAILSSAGIVRYGGPWLRVDDIWCSNTAFMRLTRLDHTSSCIHLLTSGEDSCPYCAQAPADEKVVAKAIRLLKGRPHENDDVHRVSC